jgi:hypothetical protein
MPIYVVNARNQRVVIPTAPLIVSITGAEGRAALELNAAAPNQPVMRASADQAVLPQLPAALSIAVRPVGSPRFAPGTVIHLSISHDVPDAADPFQVLFDPVDVSGESAVVFAQLLPRGRQIEVGVNAVADTPLSPLAAAARTAARHIIGRGGTHLEGDLVLALNASASMRPWFVNGSAAAATDIAVGIADALGIRQVTAVLVGSDITTVRSGGHDPSGPPPAGGLADAVRQAAPRWSAGARWSRLRPDFRTVVCSDHPTGAVPQGFPVILLSNDSRTTGPRLPAPQAGRDAAAELLAHTQVLDQISVDLVRAMT